LGEFRMTGSFDRVLAVCSSLALTSLLAACGGGGNSTPPPPVTYSLTVNSANPASGVTVGVNPQGTNVITQQTTPFTLTVSAGGAMILSPADTAPNGNAFKSWTGCASVSGSTCTETVNANSTVTANYATLVTPSVTVTPASQTINAAQSLNVTVNVAGGAGNPTPTGTVTLTSGNFVSSAASLSGGSATIAIPAGSLATGTDTLTAQYTPDRSSSSTYASASGSASVTVTAAPSLITPTVTVSPSSTGITTIQSLNVTIGVTGGGTSPTPTGSVILSSGSYASAAAALSAGSVVISVPAGSLPTGTDTLKATYTPDGSSSGTYSTASGSNTVTVTATPTFTLTIDSVAPSSGVAIGVSPSDINGAGAGSTPFSRTYYSGAQVVLSAPQSSQTYSFVSWTGCTSNPNPSTCDVTMTANTTVTANYNQPNVTSISVSPSSATIGTQQQFTATVSGTGNYNKTVSWTLACPLCTSQSPGSIDSNGLYITPYPAPPSVTITAKSTQNPSISGSATVALNPPAPANGPTLTVDAANQTHPISPYIYGWNAWSISEAAAKAANLPVDRWGGDATSRYNYVLDVTNSASDWYFENHTWSTGQQDTSGFNQQVQWDRSVGAITLGTVPVQGWVAKDGSSCSFTATQYSDQVAFDPYNSNCGDGLYPQGVSGCTNASGCNITGNNPTQTSQQQGPTWVNNWVAYLVGKFGTASNGGVAIYDLDNEPAWWDAVHRDVHPLPSTYDEVTTNGIATAKAVKSADPSAAVSGPVVDYWWNYFYSKSDIEKGWSTGPCWAPWQNPLDREAHGGVPFIEYYLQQFKSASNTYGSRLLDYLDMHTYFAGTYNGSGVGLATTGDTPEQEVRLDSTRVFWDPTYTDPNFPQPNYIADSDYTPNCSTPLQAPQLIPMAQKWVANDYPGTKIAFTEYNWGGQESINGAVAQADILGIFGAYGLDLATLWGPPDPTKSQVPGLMAFEIYRNYDGKNSMFGDTSLNSSSANQGQLSVYGAVRGSDKSLTILVINKTYGSLTSTLTLNNFTTSSSMAQVWQYSNANLNSIVSMPAVTVTPPAGGGTASTITAAFPGQSITLLVVPQ
jgi:hypothetical protein